MSILQKIKGKLLWILGGLVALLGILFAVKYEQDKIKKLKTEAIMVKTKNKLGQYGASSGAVAGTESTLKPIADALQEQVEQDTKGIEDAKQPKDRPASTVASEFNRMYGSNNEGGT